MLFPFLIMFREGVEAALIVGIIASYLKQIGRGHLMKSIWLGVGLATLLCFITAIILQLISRDYPQKEQELFSSIISVIAVGVLTWMVFWMRKAARSIKGELESQVEAAVQSDDQSPDRGSWMLVGMAFFAVLREGLETVVFLLATFQQNLGIQAPMGALFGYAAAIAVGIGIYQGSIRINLRKFFKWTGLFIIFVAAGLLASSVRAAHEAGVWNSLQAIVYDASAIVPNNGVLGSILTGFFGYNEAPTLGEVIAYLGYLVPTVFLFFWGANSKQRPTQTSL